MFYSLRSIALLMLVAGVCLGVFAGTLMANKASEVLAPSLDRKVEEQVNSYKEFYDLDALTADAIRHELQRHRRAVRDKLLQLRMEHRETFSELVKTTESQIAAILIEAGALPASKGSEEPSKEK